MCSSRCLAGVCSAHQNPTTRATHPKDLHCLAQHHHLERHRKHGDLQRPRLALAFDNKVKRRNAHLGSVKRKAYYNKLPLTVTHGCAIAPSMQTYTKRPKLTACLSCTTWNASCAVCTMAMHHVRLQTRRTGALDMSRRVRTCTIKTLCSQSCAFSILMAVHLCGIVPLTPSIIF